MHEYRSPTAGSDGLFPFEIMSSTDSWSKRPHFSIEGIEVAPAAGLEVAFDKSPEVFSNPLTEKKKRGVPFWKCRKINWRRKAFGVPLLWTVIGITAFVVGIATGGIIVSAIASKERPLRAGRYVLLLKVFINKVYKSVAPHNHQIIPIPQHLHR